CTLKKLWNLDEQSRFRELRKRIPLLAPFLDERLARLNSSVEGDIIQLLAIERPHLCVLPWLAAQPVPVSARRHNDIRIRHLNCLAGRPKLVSVGWYGNAHDTDRDQRLRAQPSNVFHCSASFGSISWIIPASSA